MIFEYYTEKELGDEIQQYTDIFVIDPVHSAPFVFDMFRLDWHAEQRASRMAELYARIPAGSRPVHALGNHDQSRIVSRFGEKQARALALAQMTLPGMPVIYYGEEIGMRDFEILKDARRDNFEEGGGMGGRDPERTPMQWSDTTNAGFSTAEPWLPISQDYHVHNVELEQCGPSSFLSLYRSVLQMRQHYPAFRNGTYQQLDVGNAYVWAYRVFDTDASFDVLVNFADQPQVVNVTRGLAVISSETVRPDSIVNGTATLAPFEALLLKSSGVVS
jgi:alpha-glucosidase